VTKVIDSTSTVFESKLLPDGWTGYGPSSEKINPTDIEAKLRELLIRDRSSLEATGLRFDAGANISTRRRSARAHVSQGYAGPYCALSAAVARVIYPSGNQVVRATGLNVCAPPVSYMELYVTLERNMGT
jgi:hypothetical protein